jgi:N-acetylglucosamine-6-phosphate deacetylase
MSNSLVIRRARVVSSWGVVESGYIVIERGAIVEVGNEPYSGSQCNVIDAEGLYAVPGFVDTHTHGVKGLDVTVSRDPYTILEMAKQFTRYGVSAFLPTVVTAPLETLAEVCKAVSEAMDMWRPGEGARVLGLHMEGPYINPDMAGAQSRAFIRAPSLSEFKLLYEGCRGVLRQVTVAPEVAGAQELIPYAKSLGIVVSAGHTKASYEEGVKAVELGVTKATHLFNAMTRFSHREPGIALALLQSPKVFLEVIADFVHLHPAVVKMVIDLAGPERVALVTDSIAATGMPDGVYVLGNLEVVVKQGVCRLVGTEVLAGSTLTMDKAFRNVVGLGYSLSSVATMASLTPVKSLGLGLRIGDIRRGYRADITILDDELRVVKTIVDGEVAYEHQ